MKKFIVASTIFVAFATVGMKSNAQNFDGVNNQINTSSNNSLTFASSQNNSMTFASTQPQTFVEAVNSSEAPKSSPIYGDSTQTTDATGKGALDLLLGTGVAGSLMVLRRKGALRA